MNVCMDSEAMFSETIVPMIGDDLASHLASFLSSPAHASFLRPDLDLARTTFDDALNAIPSEGDQPHFHHRISIASISTEIKFTALFARRFRILRRNLVGEKQFIASLTSCALWHEHGGKSRARFRLTSDGRFILKSLSEREYRTLLANTISYISYLEEQNGRSCLVPILGIFRLEYTKTAVSSLTTFLHRIRYDVELCVVVPNLLAGMNVAGEFDLKGSRILNGVVTADSHERRLFAFTNGMPLAIAKDEYDELLERIERDTEFLVRHQIPGAVDYSILIGVDNDAGRLAVGLIDYVSQYTFERKLENRLKTAQANLFGLQSPTVISPVEYRRRLLTALRRYFFAV